MAENNNTDENQGGDTQNAESTKTEGKGDTQNAENNSSEARESSEQDDKKFTQDDLDAVVQKRLKREKKTWEKQSKMSDDERLKDENEQLKRDNQTLKAKSQLVSELRKADAQSPELLFQSIRDDLEFDKAGKLSNATNLVKDLKRDYPEQFGKRKPRGSADGGAGGGDSSTSSSMNDMIRRKAGKA